MVRDKKTLLTMVLIPLLLFPLIFFVSGTIAEKQFKKNQEKKLIIGVLYSDSTNSIISNIANDSSVLIKYVHSIREADTLVQTDEYDLALFPSVGFADSLDRGKKSTIKVYFKSTESWKKNRITKYIDDFELLVVNKRMEEMNISSDFMYPVKTELIDKAEQQEKLGSTIGGMIPYIFILFCFMGCMYPAIDLFAGEKERGTIETLFTLPVTRMQILSGKLITIMTAGLFSALISMFGLFVGLKAVTFLPHELLTSINSILTFRVILLIVIMMIPFSLFIASVLTMFATYAKNYKEAQSTISPLTIVIILPAILGMMPGVEYNLINALIPILNISLATKEIISGTLEAGMFLVTLVSLVLFASAGTWLSSKWFLKESVMMRV